jgi:hypothetical protein
MRTLLTATECNKEQLAPFKTAVLYLCYYKHCSQPGAVTIQFVLPTVWWTADHEVFLCYVFLSRVIYMHVTLECCDILACRPGDTPFYSAGQVTHHNSTLQARWHTTILLCTPGDHHFTHTVYLKQNDNCCTTYFSCSIFILPTFY